MARVSPFPTRSRARRQSLRDQVALIARECAQRPVFWRDRDGEWFGNIPAAALLVGGMTVAYVGGMELLSYAIAGAFF